MTFLQKNFATITTSALVVFTVVGSFLPMVSMGDTTATTQLPNPLATNSVQGVLYLIADIGTYVGVILAVLALIYVGFKFVAAQGNPEKISDAKMFLLYVVIGVAILIGARAIIDILKNTLTSAGVVQPGVFGGTS